MYSWFSILFVWHNPIFKWSLLNEYKNIFFLLLCVFNGKKVFVMLKSTCCVNNFWQNYSLNERIYKTDQTEICGKMMLKKTTKSTSSIKNLTAHLFIVCAIEQHQVSIPFTLLWSVATQNHIISCVLKNIHRKQLSNIRRRENKIQFFVG